MEEVGETPFKIPKRSRPLEDELNVATNEEVKTKYVEKAYMLSTTDTFVQKSQANLLQERTDNIKRDLYYQCESLREEPCI